jgi:hypothetical protein
MRESWRSVRPSWIGFGWFIAVSITSLILLALAAFDIIGDHPTEEGLWVAFGLLVGFFVAGFFVGTRVVAAPVLHGLGMGLMSLGVWFLLNLVLGEATGETTWRSLEAEVFAGLMLLQTVAAVVGSRMGVRWMRRA